MQVSRTALVTQLRALGVMQGQVLLVHSSFRALRPVEGGPHGVLEGLCEALGPEGTLVMPSWTGWDDLPFDPRTTPASKDLGVLPDTLWRLPGARRSAHPFAFAALGPEAERIVDGPMTIPPHAPDSPVDRVRALDGRVLLLGVGHEANTTLHLAELLAGVPYRVPHSITVMQDVAPVRVDYGENDSCCQQFALADGWLRHAGLQSEGPVGNAQARLFRSQAVVALAVEHLRESPLLFLHAPEDGCRECADARASIPGATAAGPTRSTPQFR
jgi:aminoglycoside N3'-acetyltransferase